ALHDALPISDRDGLPRTARAGTSHAHLMITRCDLPRCLSQMTKECHLVPDAPSSALPDRQWRGPSPDGRTPADAARPVTARPWPDRCQEGLRHGELWRVHRFPGWAHGLRLPHARRRLRGQAGPHVRGPGAGYRARSGPEGVCRGGCLPVRLLHTRPDHEPAGAAGRDPGSNRRRYCPRGQWEPLPLRSLCAYRPGRTPRGGAAEGIGGDVMTSFEVKTTEQDGQTQLEIREQAPGVTTWDESTSFSVVGKGVSRLEAFEKVTGRAQYSSDVRLPRQAY